MFGGKDETYIHIIQFYDVGHILHAFFNLYNSQRVIYHSLENCTSYIMAIENDYVDIDYKSNARALEKGEVDILQLFIKVCLP